MKLIFNFTLSLDLTLWKTLNLTVSAAVGKRAADTLPKGTEARKKYFTVFHLVALTQHSLFLNTVFNTWSLLLNWIRSRKLIYYPRTVPTRECCWFSYVRKRYHHIDRHRKRKRQRQGEGDSIIVHAHVLYKFEIKVAEVNRYEFISEKLCWHKVCCNPVQFWSCSIWHFNVIYSLYCEISGEILMWRYLSTIDI